MRIGRSRARRRRRRGQAARGCKHCGRFWEPGNRRAAQPVEGAAQRAGRAGAGGGDSSGGVETVGFRGCRGGASRPYGVGSAAGAVGDAGSRCALESGTEARARRRSHGARATPLDGRCCPRPRPACPAHFILWCSCPGRRLAGPLKTPAVCSLRCAVVRRRLGRARTAPLHKRPRASYVNCASDHADLDRLLCRGI